MLTKQERQQLRQIERNIYATDPHWARLIAGGRPSEFERKRHRVRNLVLDVLAALVVLAGVLLGQLVLISLGVAVAVVAACLHVSRRRRTVRPRLA
jgi:Flp pilus assembly protein TadB